MIFERVISRNVAANVLLFLFVCGITFHVLIFFGFIRGDIVWGGRVEEAQLKYFEGVSIFINLLIILVVSMKVGYLRPWVSTSVINAVLWVLVFLFLLNTIGNIFAVTMFERLVFTPVTLVSAILCYRLVAER